MKGFLGRIKKYTLFIVMGVVIIFLIIVKFTSKSKTTENINIITQTTKTTSTAGTIINTTPTTPLVPTIKELSKEEISNLSYDDYVKYAESLSLKEEQQLPPLALDMSESFPYEEDTFLAEKFENLKVYAKSKVDDKSRAERDLKYWYYIEIGATLPSEQIIWE